MRTTLWRAEASSPDSASRARSGGANRAAPGRPTQRRERTRRRRSGRRRRRDARADRRAGSARCEPCRDACSSNRPPAARGSSTIPITPTRARCAPGIEVLARSRAGAGWCWGTWRSSASSPRTRIAEIGVFARERGVERLLATGRCAALAVERFGTGGQWFPDTEALGRELLARLRRRRRAGRRA